LSRIDKSIPIILIDDLCDAGGTFIAAAKYLRDELKLQNELNLFVGHGLFTKGLDPLLEHFNKIICTNSYQNIEHPRVDQIKVI
jgi:ribose-phosphate pyrophosphokinase